MQLIQFLAAWLFPGAQCFAVDMDTADSSELDRASSSSTPSFSANAAGSGSSVSSPSSTSSSSDGRHSGLFKSSQSRKESPSTTPLCFGAGGGGAGAGRRLLRGSRARAPAKQQDAATMATKVKGDVVGRYLRKISRRLRKARSDGKGSPSTTAAAGDDTARERAESVARAISYCKDTLRRGTSRSRSRSRSPSRTLPPPPPSPSLDEWLSDRQEEIIASAAEQHRDECSDPRPSPTRPRRGPAAGWPLGMQTMSTRFKESPCSAAPSRDGSLAAIAVAHGEEEDESPPHHGHGCRGELMSSLDEMEFLKTFDGDEEMINHHFITVEL